MVRPHLEYVNSVLCPYKTEDKRDWKSTKKSNKTRLAHPSWPNKASLKCPSVRPYVHPSTKSFFDFNEIWYVVRGQRLINIHVCSMTRSKVKIKVKVTSPWKSEIRPFSKAISSPIYSGGRRLQYLSCISVFPKVYETDMFWIAKVTFKVIKTKVTGMVAFDRQHTIWHKT